MSVFDTAKNMTPLDTSAGRALRPEAKVIRTEERDDFRVTYVTQSQMDELSGSTGFLSFTQPPTGEMFIVKGLPESIRDVALGIDRERMWAGITGPGLQGESALDLIAELQRIEQGPQLFPSDTEYEPRLSPVQSAPSPSIFRTPSHPNVYDYFGRAVRPLPRRY